MKLDLWSEWTTHLVLAVLICTSAAWGEPLCLGTELSARFHDAEGIYTPNLDIPDSLKENAFNSFCVARFFIDRKGNTTVKLITSSGSDEVDDFALSVLKRWRFKPATLDDRTVDSCKKIKVEFEVN